MRWFEDSDLKRKVAVVAGGAAVFGLSAYVGYLGYRRFLAPEVTVAPEELFRECRAVESPSFSRRNGVSDDYAQLKQSGNELFKSGQFEEAVRVYESALAVCPSANKRDRAICHHNRAAAFEKLECSEAIALDRTYKKAYVRRANANRSLDDYQQALHDLTIVCMLESFANQSTLEEADSVLKLLAESKAKEAQLTRKPGEVAPLSLTFVESYLGSFCEDPILNAVPSMGGDGDGSGSGLAGALRLLAAKRYDDVSAACTRALAESDGGADTLDCLVLRATFSLIQGNAKQAAADFDEFFERFSQLPEDEQTRLNKVSPLVVASDGVALELRVNAFIKRGSFHMQQGRKDESLADFKKAEEADAENADVFHHRGQLRILIGEVPKAAEDFRRCVELRPDFGVARVQAAYAEYRSALERQSSGDMVSAIVRFEEVVKQFSDCAEGYALLGQVYTERENFADAAQMFDRALELQPQNANIHVHKGLLELQRSESIETALALIRRAIEVDPHCEFAYETLGTIEVQSGNISASIAHFDEALKLARTELEMTHIFGMREAAMAQRAAAAQLGVALPSD